MKPNKIANIVRELRSEFEKMGKLELWEYCNKQYYLYCDSRDWSDFEAGRFAYLFYKRKGGKRIFKNFELKFRKPAKTRRRFHSLRIRLRRRSEARRLKRRKKSNRQDLPTII